MSSLNKNTVSVPHVVGAAARLALVVGFFSGTSVVTAAPTAPTVEDLGWLAGDWVSADGAGPTIETHYGTAAGGILMGQMRMLEGETLAFYEFESFKVEDGVLKVSPLPFGGPGVTFDASSMWQSDDADVEGAKVSLVFPVSVTLDPGPLAAYVPELMVTVEVLLVTSCGLLVGTWIEKSPSALALNAPAGSDSGPSKLTVS